MFNMKSIQVGVAFFCIGFFLCWLWNITKPPVKQVGTRTVDTVIVKVRDTIKTVDTKTVIKPEVVYRTQLVRDTGVADSMRAEIVKLRQYVADQTFKDSAYVRHTWLMDELLLVKENRWEYRPAPIKTIYVTDSVMVYPSTITRLLTGAGYFLAGAGTGFLVGAIAK